MLYNDVTSIERCQRNWNYEKHIDSKTIDYLYNCGIGTPTKQNLQSFNLYLFTDLNEIEKIATSAAHPNYNEQGLQNPQVYAPLLFMWEYRKEALYEKEELTGVIQSKQGFKEEVCIEVGISSCAIALAAAQLNMKTGFCRCFDDVKFPKSISEKYSIRPRRFVLFLGVGYPVDKLPHNWCNDMKNFRPTYNKPIIPKNIF